MNLPSVVTLTRAMSEGVKGVRFKKWVSLMNHEEVIMEDEDNNLYEIKFTPAENR